MNNDVFETMPVPKAYFKMALPVVFGMVISLVYNMVDTWFIAKTQNTSLVAGVSLCAPDCAILRLHMPHCLHHRHKILLL